MVPVGVSEIESATEVCSITLAGTLHQRKSSCSSVIAKRSGPNCCYVAQWDGYRCMCELVCSCVGIGVGVWVCYTHDCGSVDVNARLDEDVHSVNAPLRRSLVKWGDTSLRARTHTRARTRRRVRDDYVVQVGTMMFSKSSNARVTLLLESDGCACGEGAIQQEQAGRARCLPFSGLRLLKSTH